MLMRVRPRPIQIEKNGFGSSRMGTPTGRRAIYVASGLGICELSLIEDSQCCTIPVAAEQLVT